MKKYTKSQLFLIEVIVSLSVLIIIVTALFSTQNFTPPISTTNLQESGENAIKLLVESGELFLYFEAAFNNYDLNNLTLLSESDPSKIPVMNTITSSIPSIANYKATAYRYNSTQLDWQQIDIVNYESDSSGFDVVDVEYYAPGYNGIYQEIIFRLFLWYEVNI
ncbi:MAG: hypothetical protein OEZ01_04400 [Candidatus Heimdallarchaeota archaeon]|nr:hypothetical protein [Candidatus Heimdallarchaeota archaeon]MDH5645222.1 hypothetical protein [Candidatus Heimdallarchaeota archaeon]